MLEGQERLAEIALAALRSAGLEDADAAMCDHILVNYTAGVASIEAELRAASPAADVWRRSYAMLPADAFPNCVALASHMFGDPRRHFELGLDLLLDGIARMADGGGG